MHIKRNYNFIIDKEAGKIDGKLRLRVKWNNNKSIVNFNLGYRVEPTKWSKETARCKNNTTHGTKKTPASVINRKIQDFENYANEVFSMYEAKGIIPSKDLFRASFLSLIGEKGEVVKQEENLLDIYDKFVNETGRLNDWTLSTNQKFAALRNKLEKFNPETCDTFTEDGLNSFILFLREQYNMRNSTIAQQLGFLKYFLKWAYSKGYNKQVAYQSYAPKLKHAEKRIIFLTWEELMTVYNFDFPTEKSYITRVRDVFCFCCFTSLRYSDVANLKESDIYENHIEVTTVKTADSLKIELNDYSRAILNKYKKSDFPNNLALPVISNQRMNDYLKEMGEMCGIDTPIRETYYIGNERYDKVSPKYALLGTHAGRRTFICNALMLGIAPNIIMKWTGHSDYKAMKPYIDIADKAKEDAMQLFNKNK